MKSGTLAEYMAQYLAYTEALQQECREKEFEPERIVEILNEREQLIQLINPILHKGESITDDSIRNMVDKIRDIESEIQPFLTKRFNIIQDNLNKIKQSKNIQKNYQEYSNYEYGAFIDKKN